MRELEERIRKDGIVLPGEVLKVGAFLNQQIDVPLIRRMGEEIERLYRGEGITRVLTIESSGIPFAFACASALNVPMSFIKKHQSSNVGDDVYRVTIHSYTHGNDYSAVISKEYLHPEDRVLLVDDFLASGSSLSGMLELTRLCGCTVAGVAIAIEKQHQNGGEALRKKGIRIESLAKIRSMSEQSIEFAD